MSAGDGFHKETSDASIGRSEKSAQDFPFFETNPFDTHLMLLECHERDWMS